MSRVIAAVEEQHATAARARAAGVDLPDLDRAHAATHVLTALYEAKPEAFDPDMIEATIRASAGGPARPGEGFVDAARATATKDPMVCVLRSLIARNSARSPSVADKRLDLEAVELALSSPTASEAMSGYYALWQRRKDEERVANATAMATEGERFIERQKDLQRRHGVNGFSRGDSPTVDARIVERVRR